MSAEDKGLIIDKDLINREKTMVWGNAGNKLIDFVSSQLEMPTDAKIRRYIMTMGASEIIKAIQS